MIDKDLFLHDLAVVAILKNEAPYLREWLDYHLLAGVDHFYLYDNESTDNQAKVAKPYVEAGLVDYFPVHGSIMQMPVFNEAVKHFKFHCRYMAFIDCDEFIFPKSNRSVVEVVDEILSRDLNAAGLAINWQIFGSNGHDTADYSRGVLERFTHRAPSDWIPPSKGNAHVKHISNPRKIYFIYNPHCARYFEPLYPVNEDGKIVTGSIPNAFNIPVTSKKIVVNHYYCKSREEFTKKIQRGRCDQAQSYYSMDYFELFNRNEEFDDGILKYRAARADSFSVETKPEKIRRVENALTATLTKYADDELSDLETALTCRAASNFLGLKVHEEASLAAILKSLGGTNTADARLLTLELPKLLKLPYPAVEDLRGVALQTITQLMERAKFETDWREYIELNFLQELLKIRE